MIRSMKERSCLSGSSSSQRTMSWSEVVLLEMKCESDDAWMVDKEVTKNDYSLDDILELVRPVSSLGWLVTSAPCIVSWKMRTWWITTSKHIFYCWLWALWLISKDVIDNVGPKMFSLRIIRHYLFAAGFYTSWNKNEYSLCIRVNKCYNTSYRVKQLSVIN